MDILADLDARGLIHDTTDRAELATLLAEPAGLYHGIDPTADSLHAGNFVGVLALRRFQDAGHRPVALVGGATGMVGDPSGRSDERSLLDDDTLAANIAAIRGQLERFLDFGPGGARLVDNRAWTEPIGVLDFLRDVGKHVTVNQMLAKESVRNRLDSESGISFTEFSYMLLQAFDFWWLFEHEGVRLQIGGSDQWGNITAGIDLIRRRHGGVAHGLTWPLVTRSDGQKFGKSSGADVWLSAERTSPYRFFQYWMQIDDRDVARFLRQLTLLDLAEIDDVMARHESAPQARDGQRRLAQELTELVHGPEAARGAAEASAVLFGSDPTATSAAGFAALAAEIPTSTIADLGATSLLDVLSSTDLVTSRGDARRAVAEGGIYVNGERVTDPDAAVGADRLLAGGHLLVRRGRRRWHLIQAVG